jgi:hypothetical protein
MLSRYARCGAMPVTGPSYVITRRENEELSGNTAQGAATSIDCLPRVHRNILVSESRGVPSARSAGFAPFTAARRRSQTKVCIAQTHVVPGSPSVE